MVVNAEKAELSTRFEHGARTAHLLVVHVPTTSPKSQWLNSIRLNRTDVFVALMEEFEGTFPTFNELVIVVAWKFKRRLLVLDVLGKTTLKIKTVNCSFRNE